MNIKYRRVVKDTFSRKSLNEKANQQQWILFALFPETESNPYEIIYLNPAQDTAIHYIEDDFLQLAYILVRGDQDESVLQEAESVIPVYLEHEIVFFLEKAESIESKVQALHYAAITAPDTFYEYYFNRFLDALKSTDIQVRNAAIIGIGYVGWREFQPVLEQIAESDPVQVLRDNAQKLLEGFSPRWKSSQ